ncbi:MAG: hypothetical protein AAFW75_10615, partial [Cyanobacteria bacterium J06636_16]
MTTIAQTSYVMPPQRAIAQDALKMVGQGALKTGRGRGDPEVKQRYRLVLLRRLQSWGRRWM